MTVEIPERRGRGRRPADAVRANVLQAVGDLLLTEGSAELTFAQVMTQTPGGRVLTELIGQSQTDPDLAQAYRALYSARRRRLACDRMRQAQDAGQLRPEVDPQVVVDQLWGAVCHRLLVPDEPVTDAFIVALVSNLLDGIASRGTPRAERDARDI